MVHLSGLIHNTSAEKGSLTKYNSQTGMLKSRKNCWGRHRMVIYGNLRQQNKINIIFEAMLATLYN